MAVKQSSFSRELIPKLVFFCVFGFSLFMGLCLTVLIRFESNQSEIPLTYLEHWKVIDQSGVSFETGRTFEDSRAYTEDFTLVTKLPSQIENDSLLCFLNKSDVSVYINGEPRKDFKKERDTGMPGGNLKEFYIQVPLSSLDSGGDLVLIRHRTDWNPVVVPPTFVTTPEGFYAFMLDKYGGSFGLSVVLFVAALLVIVIGLALRIWKHRTIEMLYGALGIFVVACWLLSVSQLTPFLTRIYYVDGLMGFLFTMMMPFALLIYINSIQKRRYQKCHTVLFALSLFSFVLFTTLHFTGIRSFQQSLVYIDSILGLIVVAVLVTLFLDLKRHHIREYLYSAVGFLLFLSMSLVEIIMIIFFELKSNEIPMLIGLLCLLILMVVQQTEDIRKVRSDLEHQVSDKVLENEQMLIQIVQTLAGTIDAKDTYTNGHSSRVADYSREIARRFGYSEADQNDIYMMGLLHDIGKLGIPDAVINSTEELSEAEADIIKQHPLIGAKILENITEKPTLSLAARWHHERFDGSGYPDGIKGDYIPEPVRIIAVADAYDAMTSYRSYREPLPQKKVRKEIENGMGTQFDPVFAAIMLEMIDEDKDYRLKEKKTTSPVLQMTV